MMSFCGLFGNLHVTTSLKFEKVTEKKGFYFLTKNSLMTLKSLGKHTQIFLFLSFFFLFLSLFPLFEFVRACLQACVLPVLGDTAGYNHYLIADV